MQRTIKITDDTYKKLKELKIALDRSYVWILRNAVGNYFMLRLSRRLNKKK